MRSDSPHVPNAQSGVQGRAADMWPELRKQLVSPVAIALAISALLFVLGELISPGFAQYSQIVNVLRIASFLGIIAAGQTLVVLAGGEGVDLSIGTIVTFAAIVGSRTIQGDNAMVPLGLAEMLAVGFLLGAVNGVGIARLRIPPLVMTLGMAGVVRGLMLVYTKGQPGGQAAPVMEKMVSGDTVFGIPGILWIWVGVAVLMTLLLRRTAFGRRVYAIGTNRTAAFLSGTNVGNTIIVVYGLSGMLAALGGFFLLGYTSTVFLSLGDSYMLPSVAAVVVGGTTLAGGQGGYVGTVAGAIVLTVLQSILVTLQMGEAGRQIVYGIVLLALLSAYGRQRRLRQ